MLKKHFDIQNISKMLSITIKQSRERTVSRYLRPSINEQQHLGVFSTARICLTRMTLNAEDDLPFTCQIFIRSNSTSVYRLQNSTYQMLTWVTLYYNFLFVCIPIFVTEELCIIAEGKYYSSKTRARCVLFSPEKTIKKGY